MTVINSFLQKKKLREFGHGTYMVMAAYVLSFLLLIIGSDTLYNIKSKANGLSTQSDEVNQISLRDKNSGINNPYDTTDSRNNSYQVEYRMDYIQKSIDKYQQSISESLSDDFDDTNWLLGHSMNDEEYGLMMAHMNKNEVFTEIDEKEISSFSASALTTEDLSSNKLSLTKEEIKMLEQIVEAEATGEDIIGKILVANVIFNRIEDEKFPDNVEDVIFQKDGKVYQFSPISDKRFWKVKITSETKEAVQRAMDGEDYSKGALYFMARRLARKSSIKWFDNNLQWLFKHGDHEFYK
ncbi:MAG: cell wall hydrolase [Clostridiales bacterium]|jgi:N-acetylmuramoyl-L-alanine amidase|nr:cell wall hydrolase [Clostridiales bacterium]